MCSFQCNPSYLVPQDQGFVDCLLYSGEFELTLDPFTIHEEFVFVGGIERKSRQKTRVRIPLSIDYRDRASAKAFTLPLRWNGLRGGGVCEQSQSCHGQVPIGWTILRSPNGVARAC